MNYIALKKDDFDRFVTYKKQHFLCYSAKRLKEISPDGDFTVVGLTRDFNGVDDYMIELDHNKMSVVSSDMENFRYKTIGYIPVEGLESDNEYIAIQKKKNPLIIKMNMMISKLRHENQF